MLRNNTVALLALGAALFLLANGKLDLPNINLPDLGGGGGGSVEPVTPEPSEADKAAVQSLVGLVPNAQDRADLVGLYNAMATTIEKGTSTILTTNDVLALNASGGQLFMDIVGKSLDTVSPGLGGENGKLNAIVVSMLGKGNETLTPAKRSRSAAAFRALAWGFEQ